MEWVFVYPGAAGQRSPFTRQRSVWDAGMWASSLGCSHSPLQQFELSVCMLSAVCVLGPGLKEKPQGVRPWPSQSFQLQLPSSLSAYLHLQEKSSTYPLREHSDVTQRA